MYKLTFEVEDGRWRNGPSMPWRPCRDSMNIPLLGMIFDELEGRGPITFVADSPAYFEWFSRMESRHKRTRGES